MSVFFMFLLLLAARLLVHAVRGWERCSQLIKQECGAKSCKNVADSLPILLGEAHPAH
jgi:hypothetical protein